MIVAPQFSTGAPVVPHNRWRASGTLATTALLLTGGCATRRVDRTLVQPQAAATLDQKSAFLKAHLRSGAMYLLDHWSAESGGAVVVGQGQLLGINREVIATGSFRLPADSVALFETNVVRSTGAGTALTVVSGITAAVTGFCIASPKSCFGSCPTFYVADSSGPTLQAEGFSASVAPALEATDIDALWHAVPRGRNFDVLMTNEALETHVLRHVDVIAVARPAGGRVAVTSDGRFLSATDMHVPSHCTAAEGDCTEALRAHDGRMRSSGADSTDLAAREFIDLEFAEQTHGTLGILIASRQSLLSTYLFYQGLAYLGSSAGHWLAALQAGDARASSIAAGVGRLLGQIDVLVPDSVGGWQLAGSVGETGPLATDTKVVPIPPQRGTGPVRVRLRLTRGLWRIDWVSLVTIDTAGPPQRMKPVKVEHFDTVDRAALALVRDGKQPLTTLPGDRYVFRYRLPRNPARWELFLDARGYYLEWMRREWLAEENAILAARYFLDPAGTLRALAPTYKAKEAGMDSLFWSSRYVRR